MGATMVMKSLIIFLVFAAVSMASVSGQPAKSPPAAKPAKPKTPPAPKPPKPPVPKKVKCTGPKRLFPRCSGVQFTCPTICPKTCFVDCVRCSPVCACITTGSVCEDPRFVGADGVTFYFHGKKDRDFCLVSDADLHINAHFFGKRDPSMTRNFTWVQSIAVLFGDHRVYIGAKKTQTWDDYVDRLEISFDGENVALPAKQDVEWTSSAAPGVHIVRTSDVNAMTLEVEEQFKISATVVPISEEESRIHNYGITQGEDCFAHLELGFKFYSLTNEIDGVLGQTYREGYVSKVKISAKNPIMGGEDKFSSSSLYSTDCAVAKFRRASGTVGIALPSAEEEYMKCSSGVGGKGIVCKK